MYNIGLDMGWDGSNGNLSLFRYVPWNTRQRHVSTSLILDFKEGKPLALKKVKDLAIQAWLVAEDDFSGYQCHYLVSAPCSRADRLNTPCEIICATLAEQFPYLTHLPGALKRVKDVPKSAIAGPGQRTTYPMHRGSIRYVGPKLSLPNETIILVDDVITRGETSRACRDILRGATHCKFVLGFFIGRTVS